MSEIDNDDVKLIVEIISCVTSKKYGCVHRKKNVHVTKKEYDHGMHYSFAEKKLKSHGYKLPMMHFTRNDLPTFFKNAYIPSLFHY